MTERASYAILLSVMAFFAAWAASAAEPVPASSIVRTASPVVVSISNPA